MEELELAQKQKSYEWIRQCIESSNNPFHIECCKKLIELFVKKYKGVWEEESELIDLMMAKENQINYF